MPGSAVLHGFSHDGRCSEPDEGISARSAKSAAPLNSELVGGALSRSSQASPVVRGELLADARPFSTNELVTYEGLGLCPEGKGGDLIESGAVTYGGKFVVNPSGGLISKGHPLGATGLAQCAELNWQLRGMAEKRQVPGAKVALQHNLGLGGAAVVTMYRKSDVV